MWQTQRSYISHPLALVDHSISVGPTQEIDRIVRGTYQPTMADRANMPYRACSE